MKNGAEVDLQGKTEGFTALMMATAEGHVEVVRLLLAHGSSADIINRGGDTADKFAREKGHADLLKLMGKATLEGDKPKPEHCTSIPEYGAGQVRLGAWLDRKT